MTNPDPCAPWVEFELGSPKNAKIVTTPGERSRKIRAGSNAFPGSGAALLATDAGSGVAAGTGPALTTTVFVLLPIQPAPAPTPSAAAAPSSAAATSAAKRSGKFGPRPMRPL